MVAIDVASNDERLQIDTDESYSLVVDEVGDVIIHAATAYGAIVNKKDIFLFTICMQSFSFCRSLLVLSLAAVRESVPEYMCACVHSVFLPK